MQEQVSISFRERKLDLVRGPVHFEPPYRVTDASRTLATHIWHPACYFSFRIYLIFNFIFSLISFNSL